MTARDELAQSINKALDDVTGIYDTSEDEDLGIADALLAEGWGKQRTVATVEELDALPDDSVILDVSGDVSQLRGERWCGYEMAHLDTRRMAKYLPATVLYEPQS